VEIVKIVYKEWRGTDWGVSSGFLAWKPQADISLCSWTQLIRRHPQHEEAVLPWDATAQPHNFLGQEVVATITEPCVSHSVRPVRCTWGA